MASTREAVLAVAAQVLAEEGLGALTVERIAGAVGVKPASLYHHFASRDEIVAEVMTAGAEAVRTDLAAALAEVPLDQPLRRLECAVRAHLRAVDAHRPFTTAYARNVDHLPGDLRDRVTSSVRGITQLWHQVLTGAADGDVFPPYVDLKALHTIVGGTVTSTALRLQERGGDDVDGTTALLIDMIRAAASRPGHAGTELVRVETNGPIARIRLASPPVNSLTIEVVAGIGAAIETVSRSAARVVLVESAVGGEFCGGADLALLRRLDPPGFESYLRTLRATFDRLADASFPTIAVLDGPAMGCGLELAIACTFRVATSRATFGVPEITMGLSPGAGSALRLPRLVGQQVALDLVLSGRTMDATEAHVTGLVDRVEGDALAAAQRWAGQMAQAPRDVLAAALRSVRSADGSTHASSGELREAVTLFEAPTAIEGIEAHAASVTKLPSRRGRKRT